VPDVLAAVDLGSNSFHMVVGRYSHGQITIVDRLRETVRLAAGLDDQDRLSREATGRALACLRGEEERTAVAADPVPDPHFRIAVARSRIDMIHTVRHGQIDGGVRFRLRRLSECCGAEDHSRTRMPGPAEIVC